MKLYHGSLQIVNEPRILVPNRTLDYGSGFYTTTSEQQAREWVSRKISGTGIGYVNIFYEQGLLSKQELITELKTYKLVDQMLFHTEKSLECLTFINAEEVHL